MKKLDLVGKRYGRLVVLKNIGARNGRTYSLCKCDCGNEIEVCNKYLQNGHIKSCGCLKKDNASLMGMRTGKENIKKAQESAKISNIKHNKSNTRLYKIWSAMKQRCNNQNSSSYNYYGKNGITICKEWGDFQNFQTWALNHGYKENLTIDRLNPLKGYSPDNCQWITKEKNSEKAGEYNRRFWCVNENVGIYIEFGNLKKFLDCYNIGISYTQAQDIIRGKTKSKNGWILGKE